MSEFFETRTAQCPWCKGLFTTCEGPLCKCEEWYYETLAEMERQEKEWEENEKEWEGNCPTS